MKVYYIQANIGRSKYVINFHDGISTHSDGSPFYNVYLCSNKKALYARVAELKRQGYVER